MEELNNEVTIKMEEILNIIKSSMEYKRYLTLKKELKKDENLIKTINDIKKCQKEYLKNPSKQLENKLNVFNNNLNNNILYSEYLNTVHEINNYLDIIKKLEDYLVNVTN